MTMIVDENPRTPAGGYPSLRAVTSRTAAPKPPASYEVVEPVQVAHPDRVLRDVRLGSGSMLDNLVPVLSYSWFSEDLYWQARKWLNAILTLYETNDLPPANVSAQQTVQWLVRAIVDLRGKDVDLFHRDRAVQAAHLLPGSPSPLRRDQIPQQRWDGRREYALRMGTLQWSPETPVAATDRLVDVSLHSMPDRWWLATYVERRDTWDSIVYAQYGNWYVKVAEWL